MSNINPDDLMLDSLTLNLNTPTYNNPLDSCNEVLSNISEAFKTAVHRAVETYGKTLIKLHKRFAAAALHIGKYQVYADDPESSDDFKKSIKWLARTNKKDELIAMDMAFERVLEDLVLALVAAKNLFEKGILDREEELTSLILNGIRPTFKKVKEFKTCSAGYLLSQFNIRWKPCSQHVPEDENCTLVEASAAVGPNLTETDWEKQFRQGSYVAMKKSYFSFWKRDY